jgi:hypothetical protein
MRGRTLRFTVCSPAGTVLDEELDPKYQRRKAQANQGD